jgi:hypothetical protein
MFVAGITVQGLQLVVDDGAVEQVDCQVNGVRVVAAGVGHVVVALDLQSSHQELSVETVATLHYTTTDHVVNNDGAVSADGAQDVELSLGKERC